MRKQVNAEHYNFLHYSTAERWSSYYYQLLLTVGMSPKCVLEVGVGSHVFGDALVRMGLRYICIDIDEAVGPDLVASVHMLPLADNSCDLVCAFQVCEHLPFDMFPVALKEMERVTSHGCIVSLPYYGYTFGVDAALPRVGRAKKRFRLPFSKRHLFDGEHYWEIGKRGYSLERIRRAVRAYFEIEHEFAPFENPYHYFFCLVKKA